MITNVKVRFALAGTIVIGIFALSALDAFVNTHADAVSGAVMSGLLLFVTAVAVKAIMNLTWTRYYTVEVRRDGAREVLDDYQLRHNAFRSADDLTSEARLRGQWTRYQVYKTLPGVPLDEVLTAGRRVR